MPGVGVNTVSLASGDICLLEEWTSNVNSTLTSNSVWSWVRQPQRHCSFFMMPTAMKLYLGRECLGATGDLSWVGCQWRMTQDQVGL
jgi:hypothetical protein